MTKAERKAEFDRRAKGSVELGRDVVQNALTWSEQIPDSAYTTEEHAALLEACQAFYMAVTPIFEKHLGED